MTPERLPVTAAPADPSPGLVVTGRFGRAPGYGVHRPGGAASWLFTWTTDGQGLVRQGAAEARPGTGDLVVLAPGVRQRYAVAPGAPHWRFWWAHCRARPSWVAWLGPYAVADGMYVATVPVALRDRAGRAFARMLDDDRRPGGAEPPAAPPGDDTVAVAHDSTARELALCALEEVVLLAAAGGRASAPPPECDARILRAEELIAADPAAGHTVRSLAAAVALSPSRFAHLFTRQTGRSPMRALREARLRQAARLLEGTDLTVERVAAASGFPSPFHFSRVFRERYGVPPGVYRTITVPGSGQAGKEPY